MSDHTTIKMDGNSLSLTEEKRKALAILQMRDAELEFKTI